MNKTAVLTSGCDCNKVKNCFLQDEECKDTFTKDCYIEYINVPKSEQVEKCVTPWQRDCDTPGVKDCTTEYETSKVFDLSLHI